MRLLLREGRPPEASAMNLADVLKLLVERLPADWDELKQRAHAAIDQAPALAAEPAEPAPAEPPGGPPPA